jgi:hypothetical protein
MCEINPNKYSWNLIVLFKHTNFLFRFEKSVWLSTADQVISVWMEVQRTWSHLESIFIGSEDIRNQLPEDSKRFDGIV